MNNSLKSSLSEIDDFIKKFKNQKKIQLNNAQFNNDDKKNIIECLNSSYVSTTAKKQEFENKLSKILNNKKVISTINGTSALHTV